jgi:hypothetical protein
MVTPTANPPLATPEQERLELAAARLLQNAAVQRAAAETAAYWIEQVQPSPQLRARFDAEFAQAAFCGVLNALNQDAGRPQLHAFGRFSHETAGVAIPGTKCGHPNPDYVYRFATIDGSGRYEVEGLTPAEAPTAFEFSILNAEQVYLGNLSKPDLTVGADGRFTIHVDPDPANGRANHLQTRPDACQILIRDMLADVAREQPYRLTIRRLDPPPAEPWSEDRIIAACGPAIRKFVDDLLWVNRNIVYKNPVNSWAPPAIHTGGVYSVAQAYAPGHFRLQEDDAFVFTLTLGTAAYAVVPVTNAWGGINDYLGHTGTWGTRRAAANPDGSYSFVLSLSDPGIANWVDPDGLHEGILFIRWVGFPRDAAGSPSPTLEVRQVRLADLDRALPAGVPRLDAAGRRAQLQRHRTDYLRAMG